MNRGWWVVALTVMLAAGCTSSDTDAVLPDLVRSIRHPDEEIFMTADAGPEQIVGVRSAIRRSPQIRAYAFLSREDAYREFKHTFREVPDLIAVTDPAIFTASFRLRFVDRRDRERFAGVIERLPGVDAVKYVYTREERLRLG